MSETTFKAGYWLKAVCIGWAVFALAGCDTGSDFSDIDQFMDQVKAEAPIGIQGIPATQLYQPYTYGASNLRSPFVAPVVVPDEFGETRRNIGVRPPRDHDKQFLEGFNIIALEMVGTLGQNDTIWALIQDADGGVHRVQKGDYMGMNWGRVERVSDARIDIIEIVSDGADGWLRRPLSIELNFGSD